MVNFITRMTTKKAREHLQVPEMPATTTTTTILDEVKEAMIASRPSDDSMHPALVGLKHPTGGMGSRRSSTGSTYSEQAEEEAHLSQEERVRLAVARLRGPQYEELSIKIYGPWYHSY